MKAGSWFPVCHRVFRWQSGLSGAHQAVNSYVLPMPNRTILIDPAGDLTEESLCELGISGVTDILITHFQEEHVAGCFHFPQARIHVPEGDSYLGNGPEAYNRQITPWPPPWDWTSRGNFQGHVAGARNERPSTRALTGIATLVPGRIAPGGLRVLPTPGQGKHAITLIGEIDGRHFGFCGDLIFGEGLLWNWFDCEWDYGLGAGQAALLESLSRLTRERLEILCPAHGEVIHTPEASCEALRRRIAAVQISSPSGGNGPINFSEKDSPASGFREILPHLHQHREGNCAILTSASGHGLMIDDGLCFWRPIPEREAHHRKVVGELKRALELSRIEVVIPTHYHGDHIENIPALVEQEGAQVICLDTVAGPMENPDEFNLACPLSWYGTRHRSIPITRKLANGARLKWREYDLELFRIGGQTFYALGVNVLIDGFQTLFVGDACDNRSPLCESICCYNQAEPVTAGWAYAIERMIERSPDFLVCGHGSAIRDPMVLLLKKRAAWRRRIEEFEALSGRADMREFFDPFFTSQ